MLAMYWAARIFKKAMDISHAAGDLIGSIDLDQGDEFSGCEW